MNDKRFTSTTALTETYTALDNVLHLSGAFPAENKPSIFHYTSTEVLDKILSNACFWASNIYYLNDAQEYREGLRRLKKVVEGAPAHNTVMRECLEELLEESPNAWEGLYTISFSLQEDSLQNWITYAKESGVCIELDRRIMAEQSTVPPVLRLEQEPRGDGFIRPIDCAKCFHPVDYQNKLSYETISRAFQACYAVTQDIAQKAEEEFPWEENRLFLKRFLRLLATYHKQQGFYGEHEARLSFFPLSADEDLVTEPPNGDFSLNETDIKYFRQSSGVLRPYLEIYFLRLPEGIHACPITSVTVGPGGHQQAVFDSLVHRLEYGVCKLWKFSDKEKENLLKRYLDGCLSTLDSLSPDERLKTARALAQKWAFSAGYVVKSCEVTSDVAVRLCADSAPPRPDEVPKEIRPILSRLSLDHYLSPHGVWVKKSKISYIF